MLLYLSSSIIIGIIKCMDVCPTNANLVGVSGYGGNIIIHDRRQSSILKTFDDVHSGNFYLSINDQT